MIILYLKSAFISCFLFREALCCFKFDELAHFITLITQKAISTNFKESFTTILVEKFKVAKRKDYNIDIR